MSAIGRKLPVVGGAFQPTTDKFSWHNYTRITHKAELKEKGLKPEGSNPFIYLVRGAGIEPARGYPHRILSPGRLPVPPPSLAMSD